MSVPINKKSLNELVGLFDENVFPVIAGLGRRTNAPEDGCVRPINFSLA